MRQTLPPKTKLSSGGDRGSLEVELAQAAKGPGGPCHKAGPVTDAVMRAVEGGLEVAHLSEHMEQGKGGSLISMI